jgi:NAD dependent epimerase/dehydratase family enzyme
LGVHGGMSPTSELVINTLKTIIAHQKQHLSEKNSQVVPKSQKLKIHQSMKRDRCVKLNKMQLNLKKWKKQKKKKRKTIRQSL